MPAESSAGLISVRSLGATVPCPPVTNILMISAPCLISSRTARRNSSGPSERLMAPRAPTSQYQGKLLSPACPVVLTSRLPAIEARTGEEPLGDGGLHGGVDGERCTRADGAGEPAAQQQLEVMGRPHGLQGRGLLEPEGCRLRAELVVGGVEVAAHHAGHDGATGERRPPGPRAPLRGLGRCGRAAMRRSSMTSVVPGRAPSASSTVASRRTSRDTLAGSPAQVLVRDGGGHPADVGVVEVGAGRNDLVDAVEHVGAEAQFERRQL